MSAELRPDRAIIDRITDQTAVVLVGPDGDQHTIDVAALPHEAEAGDVLVVGSLSPLTLTGIDVDATRDRRKQLRDRRDRIRRTRRPGRLG